MLFLQHKYQNCTNKVCFLIYIHVKNTNKTGNQELIKGPNFFTWYDLMIVCTDKWSSISLSVTGSTLASCVDCCTGCGTDERVCESTGGRVYAKPGIAFWATCRK